ncbi:MAG: hypothetical protein ABIV47_26155 [Roseiflexaceae bacterium]
MLLRRTFVLFAALSLTACGGTPLTDQATVPPAQALPTAAPPTAAPPSRETFAPPPTQPPAPTAPPPTQPPAPSATALPPTQLPVPTSAPATQPPVQAATALPAASFGSEILFLRKSALIAFDIGTRKERQIANAVIDFAASRDGALIALLRGSGRQAEIWTVRRDSSALTQRTTNDRAEAGLAWSPDGGALIYGSSATEATYQPEWMAWSAWCGNSEVRLLNLSDASETSFGPGCDPSFSPDGKRIAYATPPTTSEPDINNGPTIVNRIRLINRQGKNGWDFAKAQGIDAAPPHAGRLVYAPAWSPDGKQIVYHRFLGYQALVDLNLSEIAGSFDGKGQPIDSGAGWLLPARFAPGRQLLAITENDQGDARGFGGYDSWSVTVTSLGGSREIALPTGALTAVGQRVDHLPRGQVAAWSPDGTVLAVELPPGWKPDLSLDQPVGADGQPGEIWRWQPGSAPTERLVQSVDFASPLVWLP